MKSILDDTDSQCQNCKAGEEKEHEENIKMEGKICVVIAESEKWEENDYKVIVIMERQLLKLL